MTLIEQEKRSNILRKRNYKQAKSVQYTRDFTKSIGDKTKFNELFEEIYRLRSVVQRKDQHINKMKLKIEELQLIVEDKTTENEILRKKIVKN